jgi:15-cis-phytoene desaturase
MKRIPYEDKSVFHNLDHADYDMMARDGKDPWIFPTHGPNSTMDFLKDLYLILKFNNLGIPFLEKLYFAQRVAVMVMSCDERWHGQYDAHSYWNFTNAAKLSIPYQDYLVKGVTRNILAAKAEFSSLQTIGRTFIRLIESAIQNQLDRLLNGPTNEKWLTPMVNHLSKLGVTFFPSHTLKSLKLDGKRIVSAIVKDEQGPLKEISADHFISAIPAERMAEIVTPELAKIAPSMSRLNELRVDWMNGLQFYFNKNVTFIRGHVGYFDSPWALTSISQQQFWPDINVTKLGDGKAVDILSVDVSAWKVPGYKDGPSQGKMAMECNKQQIIDEVWYQLHRHLPKIFPANMNSVVQNVFFDPDIRFSPDGRTVSADDEPLLINVVGSWQMRPKATTEIENLFVASDYVQTETDVASMEAANEAARRAVNGVLTQDQRQDKVQLFNLYWPKQFEWERQYDCGRYKKGHMPIGWDFPIPALATEQEMIAAWKDYMTQVSKSRL